MCACSTEIQQDLEAADQKDRHERVATLKAVFLAKLKKEDAAIAAAQSPVFGTFANVANRNIEKENRKVRLAKQNEETVEDEDPIGVDETGPAGEDDDQAQGDEDGEG